MILSAKTIGLCDSNSDCFGRDVGHMLPMSYLHGLLGLAITLIHTAASPDAGPWPLSFIHDDSDGWTGPPCTAAVAVYRNDIY